MRWFVPIYRAALPRKLANHRASISLPPATRHRRRPAETSQGGSLIRDLRCVSTASESQHLFHRPLQEKHPHSGSSARAQQRAVDGVRQIAKGVVWSHRIVRWRERTRQASMNPESGHIQPDFSALVRARDYRAETFPHSRSIVGAELEGKQPAYRREVSSQLSG